MKQARFLGALALLLVCAWGWLNDSAWGQAPAAQVLAAQAKDVAALRRIFGPDSKDILDSGDEVQQAAALESFAKHYAELNSLTKEDETKVTLYIGAENWPFPIPLVQQDGKWRFDTAEGKDEIINRRIGGNEMKAIDFCRAYVEAQREYAARDRDGSGVMKYGQRLLSTPGKKDGLYWAAGPNEDVSPFGDVVAKAMEEGYGQKQSGAERVRSPFHGYYFKVLTRQGANAPGGKYDYIINGNMIAGFALVAYPAQWNGSGSMTFMVNQQGKVYQKNLGEKTGEMGAGMLEYDPDQTWTLVKE